MNKYDILDVIDEGAYGIVWKALNKDTNTLVAIKQFKEGDEEESARKTIQREIRMLKMLKSQYVIGIKEAFKKKGKIYLIFQYFECNLLNIIEKYENGLDSLLINQVVYKIVKCLRFLHDKNIVHRDVKPENILLNADYSLLKICDFGFARFLPEALYDLTDYVATRWYRSPELLVGEPYGKAVDMWAVGCMIGELVDGQPMFPGDDEVDQIHLIRRALGDLTARQTSYFSKNPKFENVQLPVFRLSESIDTRYLGRIEKNALSFMKACLKIDPKERLTVENALMHPYLIHFSMINDQFSNDEQNLLHSNRKLCKVDSKTLIVKDDSEEKKYVSTNASHKGLKMNADSLAEKEPRLNAIKEESVVTKKKSHTNLQKKEETGEIISPGNFKKDSLSKLKKMVSEEKSLKLNVDFNIKINLKVGQQEEKKGNYGGISNANPNKNSLQQLVPMVKVSKLPQIRSKPNKYIFSMKSTDKHSLQSRKTSGVISVVGESKELVRNGKHV